MRGIGVAIVATALPACAILQHDIAAAETARDREVTVMIRPGSDIQEAIDAAAPGTTIVFAPGTYNLDKAIRLKSRISLVGETGARLRAVRRNNHLTGNGVHDVLITGLDFDGGPSGGGGPLTAAIFLADHCSNVVIRQNSFHDNYDQGDLFLYNSSRIYFQRNTSGPNEYQPVSMQGSEPGVVYEEINVTDNRLSGFRRMGIETQINVSGFHIDRNEIGPFGGGNDAFALSIVNAGHNHPKMDSTGTIWGNIIHGTPGARQWGLELGQTRMTVSQNTIDSTDVGISLSAAPESVIENNSISRAREPFIKDGGYDGSAWIGANTIDGRQQTGWQVQRNGAKPPTRQPSPVS